MHRRANEAEPTKIIRFSGCSGAAALMLCDFVLRHLSPDAFGHKCKMETVKKKCALSGTRIQGGFDLVIVLWKCFTTDGIYP